MNRWKAPIAMMVILIAMSCSSGEGNPVTPDANQVQNAKIVNSPQTRLWGYWDIFISADRSTVDVVPKREAFMHLNAVRLLETMPCSTCLKIGNIKVVGPNLIEADLTLIHPYPGLLKLTGFDVRGIFISESNYAFPVSGRKIAWGTDLPLVLNADGYTSLFNPTEFPSTSPPALGYIKGKFSTNGDLSATLNPYLAFRKNSPRCMFEPGGSETRTVKLYPAPGPLHFSYAVDVNWQPVDKVTDPLTDFPPSANCQEAYRISVDIPYDLNSSWMSQNPINVEVFDHQGLDTISSVTVEAPGILTGEAELAYAGQTGDESWLFSGMITNELAATFGTYPLLVKVTDTQHDQNLGEIDGWRAAPTKVKEGWARTWGGSDGEVSESVAFDSSGGLYVVGPFNGTADFNPGPYFDYHSSNGETDIFLSKFDSDGNFIWAKTWGGIDDDQANGVTVDSSGNVYVTGVFYGSVDFDPGPDVDEHSGGDHWSAFLSRFDSNGNFQWVRTWGSEGSYCNGHGIAADALGNIYVTGDFLGTIDFDPGSGIQEYAGDYYDVFLSMFNSKGEFIRALAWGGGNDDHAHGVATDDSGGAYVIGTFRWTVDFDPGPGVEERTADGDWGGDRFLSKFDSSGEFQWVRTWDGENDLEQENAGVATDDFGNVYVAACFEDTADFDPGPEIDEHSSNGMEDAILSKFNSTGEFQWALTWGGEGPDYGLSVSVDNQGSIYVAGEFWDTVDFDPGPGIDEHFHPGNWATFLSKFDSNGNFQWARTWSGLCYYEIGGSRVANDNSGNVYVTGVFPGAIDFDFGPAEDFHVSKGDTDIFLCKFLPDGSW
ncbi:MAG: SBBP repeat-containing protein [bacterium]